jgi:hypothetical protein
MMVVVTLLFLMLLAALPQLQPPLHQRFFKSLNFSA